MHCYAHLYEKALRQSERGAQGAVDSASARIPATRRYPLVFELPVLAHDVEEAKR